MSYDNGGSAFPVPCCPAECRPNSPCTHVTDSGLSIRDWFAGMALTYTGAMLLERVKADGKPYTSTDVAVIAYEIADAMLKERSKK